MIYNIDFKEIIKLKNKLKPIYFIYFCLFSGFSFFLFAVRWYYFLEKKMKFRDCILLTFMGQGGNVVLPARAGDLIRAYQTVKETGEKYISVFFKLFIEKFIDLVFAFFIGQFAFWFIDSKNSIINDSIRWFVFIFFISFFIFIFFIKYYKDVLLFVVEKICILLKKQKFFLSKIKIYVNYFVQYLSLSYLFLPFVLTFFIWFLFYYYKFYFLGKMLGFEFSYFETLFLVFCAAMAFMIPSAPSGAGVVHVSIVTGCLILGKPKVNSIAYAFVVHMGTFIFQGFSGLICYCIWNFTRKNNQLKVV